MVEAALAPLHIKGGSPCEYPHTDQVESVNIKLSCADFRTFNGRSGFWIFFMENILSKAGVGGYTIYFCKDYVQRIRKEIIIYFTYYRMLSMEEAHPM
jgi:hypothetical protein